MAVERKREAEGVQASWEASAAAAERAVKVAEAEAQQAAVS